MDKVKCLECPVNDGFIKSFNYDVIMVSPDNSEEKRLIFFFFNRLSKNRKKERKKEKPGQISMLKVAFVF